MLCCSNSSDLSLRQLAAVTALDAVISQAAKSDWYQSHAKTDASSLVRQFALQLQQPGLLQQLPGLLSTAADQLDAVQDKARMLASTQLSMQDGLAQAWTELPSIILLQEYTKQLLQIAQHLEDLLPVGSTAPAGAVPQEICFAAQRLQLAAVAHTCRCLEQLPDDTAPGQHFEALPKAVFTQLSVSNQTYVAPSRTSNCCRGSPGTVQAYAPQQWLAGQLQASCSMLLLALCQEHSRKHVRKLQQGSSASDYDEQSRTIWHYACTHHNQLPSPYLQLCQTLGYSSRAFLFVACSCPCYSRASGRMSLVFDSLCCGLKLMTLSLRVEEQTQQLQQAQQEAQQLQQQQQEQFSQQRIYAGKVCATVCMWPQNGLPKLLP